LKLYYRPTADFAKSKLAAGQSKWMNRWAFVRFSSSVETPLFVLVDSLSIFHHFFLPLFPFFFIRSLFSSIQLQLLETTTSSVNLVNGTTRTNDARKRWRKCSCSPMEILHFLTIWFRCELVRRVGRKV
jgi:hypothetical protein